MQLVDVASLIPDAVIDLRYATDRNVLGRPLEGALQTAQLDAPAARALSQAASTLRSKGFRLVIWDAYRSEQVQQQLQAHESNPQYVSKESNHCRGRAVDVTLDDSTGNLLDMGTDHDDFSPRAHVAASHLTRDQVAHRQLLQVAMETAGFRAWPYEWWHFDFLPATAA